jgi:hypothetical protein
MFHGCRTFKAGCQLAGAVFDIVTGEPFKQSGELTGEPIKMKGLIEHWAGAGRRCLRARRSRRC